MTRSGGNLLACLVLVWVGSGCTADAVQHAGTPAAAVRDAGSLPGGPNGDREEGPSSDGEALAGLPPRTALNMIDLGDLDAIAGRSQPVTFELPVEVSSFMVQLRGAQDSLLSILSLQGPTGVRLVDDVYGPEVSEMERQLLDTRGPQFKSHNPVLANLEVAAFLFPNAPAAQDAVVGGEYELVVSASDPVGRPVDATVTVEVLWRTTPLECGNLPLTLHLTGADGLNAQTAPESERLQEALWGLDNIFASAGLRFLEPSFEDAPERLQFVESATGSPSLQEVLRHGSRPGLHVTLIDSFSDSVVGVAGGTPGPVGGESGPSSGVVIALSAVDAQSGGLGRAIAHEAGHWLGLFHTSQSGLLADPLPDTPTDGSERENLMSPEPGGGIDITPQQRAVMLRHLAVQPIDCFCATGGSGDRSSPICSVP